MSENTHRGASIIDITEQIKEYFKNVWPGQLPHLLIVTFLGSDEEAIRFTITPQVVTSSIIQPLSSPANHQRLTNTERKLLAASRDLGGASGGTPSGPEMARRAGLTTKKLIPGWVRNILGDLRVRKLLTGELHAHGYGLTPLGLSTLLEAEACGKEARTGLGEALNESP